MNAFMYVQRSFGKRESIEREREMRSYIFYIHIDGIVSPFLSLFFSPVFFFIVDAR